jgi:hypothetical protein
LVLLLIFFVGFTSNFFCWFDFYSSFGFFFSSNFLGSPFSSFFCVVFCLFSPSQNHTVNVGSTSLIFCNKLIFFILANFLLIVFFFVLAGFPLSYALAKQSATKS